MDRNPALPLLGGAGTGLVVALALLAWFGGFAALGRVDAVPLTATVARPRFVVDAPALWLLTLLLGGAGGTAVAAVAAAVSRVTAPETSRIPLRYPLTIGAILAAIMAYAVVRLGVTIAGEVAGGSAIVPVGAMTVIVAVAGLAAGTVTGPVVDALTRRSTLGAPNVATPHSGAEILRDLARAVGTPLIAAVVVAVLAVGLAQVLLSSPAPAVAIAVFALVAAAILAGTTLAALRPWERDRS